MKPSKLYQDLSRIVGSGLLCTGMLLAASGSQAATQNEISQVPPSVAEGVPPNMFFTLDDSTSMAWGYVPDAGAQAYKDKIGNTNTRRFRAASTNALYYNPSIIYEVPPAFNSNGDAFDFPKSFTDARHNGFSSSNGTVDLSESYKVIYEHKIPDSSKSEATHPEKDFKCSIKDFSSDGTKSCGKNEQQQIKIEITRSSNKCTARAYVGNDEKPVPISCSIKNNTATANMSKSGVPAYYYEFDPTMDDGKCAGKQEDSDAGGEKCYRLRWVDENSAYDESKVRLRHASGDLVDGRLNFAIWYSFYKTRALATLSAAGIAFYNLSPNVRFSWQSLIHCTELDRGSHHYTRGKRCGTNSFKPYTREHKVNFYQWLYNQTQFNDPQGTPLRSAMQRSGEFLATKSKAWVQDPIKNTGESYSCRSSYNVIMTDGMWNGDSTISAPSNHDGKKRPLPDGTEYSLQSPYKDAYDKTLADYAFHYWSTDLGKNFGLDKKVPTYMDYKSDPPNPEFDYWDPRNNPATWQHMSNYIMGLGLSTSLARSELPWEGKTHVGKGYTNLLAGTASWPQPSGANNGHANNVYDLWHAAINSRGEFYSVDSPEAMVQAFQDILSRIAERKSSAAMPGTSSAIEVFEDADGEEDGRLHQFFYQTTFNSADGWSGDLTKTERYREFNETTQEFEWVTKSAWSAASKLPAHGSRKIYMADSSGKNLIDFTDSNIANSATYDGKNLQQHLQSIPITDATQSSTYTAEDRLNYLRGSDVSEGEADGKMRQRSSKLGDFLGSSPVVVGNQGRYLEGFSNKLEDNAAYTTFLESIKNRKAMIYVGGNAGMLHAFNAETGVEEFAFVPTAVFPYLNRLTGKGYTHQYYVDGTPTVADIYDKENGKWRTILVGTLRAGGKGLFALDITDPEKISLLWEFHEYSAAAVDLTIKPGYSFPKPTVARLHNGRWAVVTGNGYKGTGANNGGAALYVIDAINGKLTKSMEVTGTTGENGLSTPRLADFDSDGVADYAYAGDLQGNLWRFDLLGGSASGPTTTPPSNGSYGEKEDGTSKFAVSYNGKPMFTAVASSGETQPITSAPSLVRHPTRLGYLVVFGTGRYVEIGDKEPNKSYAQSLYGIWDTQTKAEGTNNPPSITRSGNMTEQSFNSTDTTGKGEISGNVRNARIISNNPVEWYTDFNSTKDIKKRGWYLDFDGGGKQGEIMVEDMRTLGNTLFLQTLIPNDDPCANGAGNWLYAINPFTGGKTLHHAFDTRGTGDVILSGIQFGTEGGVSLGQDEEGYKAFAPSDMEAITPDPSSLGRQTWRMIQNP